MEKKYEQEKTTVNKLQYKKVKDVKQMMAKMMLTS